MASLMEYLQNRLSRRTSEKLTCVPGGELIALRRPLVLQHRAGCEYQILKSATLHTMVEGHDLGGALPGRAWTACGYGLGLMSGRMGDTGRAIGHSGGGPHCVNATYHFPDAAPPLTEGVQHPGCIRRRADQATMIDPPRIVGPDSGPVHLPKSEGVVASGAEKPARAQAPAHEELLPKTDPWPLRWPPDEHIASVAVGPTGPGRKIQSIGVHPLQEMLTGPGCIDIRPAGPKRVQI